MIDKMSLHATIGLYARAAFGDLGILCSAGNYHFKEVFKATYRKISSSVIFIWPMLVQNKPPRIFIILPADKRESSNRPEKGPIISCPGSSDEGGPMANNHLIFKFIEDRPGLTNCNLPGS